MKSNLTNTTLFGLILAALVAVPALSRAQDNGTGLTNAPAQAAPAHKKKGAGVPFHGKVVTVDTAAETFSVGKLTLSVTAKTKITKDGQPATLSDITVGETVRGSYKKDEAGALNALVVRIGQKAPKAQAAPATTGARI